MSARWGRRLLGGLAVVALLALAWSVVIGWWLPRFVQPRLQAQASAALGAPFTLERIEIAPWRLEARAFGARLGPPEAPWLRVAEVHVDVSIESLWRRAPVLRRLTVRAPRIELERLAPERFNVTPMIEALARRPPAPPDSEPARFALHNIRLEDGSVRFVDRVAPGEHHVTALRIGIPFLSNLPSALDVDVEPEVDALVDGSRLHLQGQTLPFTEGRRSVIALRWQQIDVAQAVAAVAPLLPRGLPLALQRGRLDLALGIAFERRAAPSPPSLHIAGTAALSQVQAEVPAQGLQVAWAELAIDGIDLRPFERRASVGAVTLKAPALQVDLPRLRAGAAQAPDEKAAATPGGEASNGPNAAGASDAAGPAWKWRVERIALSGGRVLLREPAWPQGQLLSAVEASASGLGGAAGQPAAVMLAFADAHGAYARLEGSVDVAARRVAVKAALDGFKPLPWLAPWQASLPVRLLDGSVALQARAETGAGGWALEDGSLRLTGLQLAPVAPVAPGEPARPAARTRRDRRAPDDGLTIASAAASGVRLQSTDGRPLQAAVAALHVEGLDLRASRSRGGALPWLPTASAGEAAAPRDKAPAPAATWQLGELRCSDCAVALSDRGVTPATSLALTRAQLTARGLGSDLRQPVGFELSAGVGRAGRAKARGQLRLQPLSLRSRVDLAAVDLGLLQPYLDPWVNVTLAAAKASAGGELQLDGSARERVASARWRGRLALGDLRALDRLNDAEFVRFRSLTLDDAAIDWRAAALEADLGTVTLDGFYGRVIIDSDGRINLRDIVRRAEGAAARSLTTVAAPPAPAASGQDLAAAAPAASAAAADAPLPLRWRAIRLTQGEVDFTDNFIRPNYSARLTGLAGEISALAWNEPAPAQVRVAGALDGSAPVEISGTLHPLGARLHTDITANARGIDLTRLSAYAARYAGYGIEKGTLSAQVHYRVDGGRLEAENRLTLDQLTFGQKVESPDALKIPVLLAVALLKDRNGVIDVNLPVSGSLDDPQFSIGGIVVRVIVNLVVKAVTSPFTLLSQAFAGGRQELSHVAFEPGAAEVGPAMQPALDTLAKALADRPALKLEITGRADPADDLPALRRAHVERLLRAAKARSVNEPVDKVSVDAAERARWLEAAYRSAELPGKPRNLIGLQKALPVAEMEALLLQSAPAGPEQLKALADGRANAVKAYLAAKQLPPERLLLTASRLDATGIDDKGRTTRVAFNLK